MTTEKNIVKEINVTKMRKQFCLGDTRFSAYLQSETASPAEYNCGKKLFFGVSVLGLDVYVAKYLYDII